MKKDWQSLNGNPLQRKWERRVNACLNSITLYMLSFMQAPKGFLKKADIVMKRMIWQEMDEKKKYHLVKWDKVCLPKDRGGLEALDLATMNKSLLCKWRWKLENTEGSWQQLMSKKYLQNQVLANATARPGCSHFWQRLMGVNPIFQQFDKRVMYDGRNIVLWEDSWVNNIPLVVRFLRLYSLAFKKMLTIYTIKHEGWGVIRFRRMLYGETLAQWEEMKSLVDDVQLDNHSEMDTWKLRDFQSQRFISAIEFCWGLSSSSSRK
jgi:hypothetical protein